jgi:Protein of unknown function (DUF2796)
MRKALVLVFGLGVALHAGRAEAHRELGVHEHGSGTLNIAVEGKRVTMELEVPGADIVGFEHAATTRPQMVAVEKAKQQLMLPLALFALPRAAGCTVIDAKVDIESGSHDRKDDKAAGKSSAPERGHSEFHAQYTLDCASPASLTAIEFPYFRSFAAAKKLEVNVITSKRQTKFEVTRAKPRIDLAGMM